MKYRHIEGQKFRSGQKVLISSKRHGEYDLYKAIIVGSYAQEHGGNNIKLYDIKILDHDGKPICQMAWFNESELRVID